MAKYVLTKRAVKDLTDIWNYTFDNWSEKQADKYYNEILAECDVLAENPEKGKAYFKLIEDLRGAKINKHIIFYRKLERPLMEIVRVLHERMDLKSKLNR
ncbi:type II toxin-antitoxin system RelE/ParE family toxin [Portibacter lacus]|uniref:Toxin n=1 Tax=Portibacter lacus TaxID=1099794 RepID=A0AA37SSD1_9BACT|nr:type II toxin-antitoxin system RelE/ParE family toxin [Portibacter lacus]GLR19102.1 toxin ParE1 [Portibacter lacus]